jgi:hypothetical protein
MRLLDPANSLCGISVFRIPLALSGISAPEIMMRRYGRACCPVLQIVFSFANVPWLYCTGTVTSFCTSEARPVALGCASSKPASRVLRANVRRENTYSREMFPQTPSRRKECAE